MAKRHRALKTECPHCDHDDSIVVDGWTDQKGRGYVRRRRCAHCRRTFHTIETLDSHPHRAGRPKATSCADTQDATS